MISIRGFVGAGVALVAIILIFIAMFTSGWYVIDEEGSKVSYGLSKVVVDVEGFGEVETDYSDAEEDSDAISAANVTKVLFWIGVIFALLFLVAAILGSVGVLSNIGGFGKFIPLIVGGLAGLLLLVGVIYFAAGFPSGMENDIGADPEGSLGFSWIMALIATIMTLVGAGLTFGIGGKAE
jgi:hypothetical protein